MFDGGISAKELIEEVRNEADVAYPIGEESYILWLNETEQLIYRELIQEQGRIDILWNGQSTVGLDDAELPQNENSLRFEDIHSVFADNLQLAESTATSGEIFENTYYRIGNEVRFNLSFEPKYIKIYYLVRPKLKTAENYGELNVSLPTEFLNLLKAKLRAEAYLIANEDSLAAKWLNDYNNKIENFKQWIASKHIVLGL